MAVWNIKLGKHFVEKYLLILLILLYFNLTYLDVGLFSSDNHLPSYPK